MKSRHSPHPDLILYNGKIRTFAGNGSICEALACAGGRIVAIGSSDEIRRLGWVRHRIFRSAGQNCRFPD